MVNSESEVVPSPLPSPIFYDSDVQLDASSDSDLEPLALDARSCRPFFDNDGWKSTDHYSDDLPQDSSSEGWKEKYTRMENISVNGAKRRNGKYIKRKSYRYLQDANL